jgi:hypothetical protein
MTTKLTAIIIFLTALSSLVSFSQVTEAEKTLRTQTADTVQGWKTGGVFGLNLAQTSLTNWSAGGENSVAFNGIFSVHANLIKGKSRWDNSLDIGYGLLKQGKNTSFKKTDDKFDFLSKYGQEAFKKFYYAALFNFKTQMAPGYNYPDVTNKISDLLAPAYMLFAIGMDYKPNPHFSAFIAPVTARIIFLRDQALSDAGAFGVDPGKKSKSEFGGYLRVIYTRNDFKSEFLKNVSFTTKIDLFSNYADKPQNLVVNWETLIALKVNKYISANLNTQLIYDDKVKILDDTNGNGIKDAGEPFGPRVQFKEILGIGFSYNF